MVESIITRLPDDMLDIVLGFIGKRVFHPIVIWWKCTKYRIFKKHQHESDGTFGSVFDFKVELTQHNTKKQTVFAENETCVTDIICKDLKIRMFEHVMDKTRYTDQESSDDDGDPVFYHVITVYVSFGVPNTQNTVKTFKERLENKDPVGVLDRKTNNICTKLRDHLLYDEKLSLLGVIYSRS